MTPTRSGALVLGGLMLALTVAFPTSAQEEVPTDVAAVEAVDEQPAEDVATATATASVPTMTPGQIRSYLSAVRSLETRLYQIQVADENSLQSVRLGILARPRAERLLLGQLDALATLKIRHAQRMPPPLLVETHGLFATAIEESRLAVQATYDDFMNGGSRITPEADAHFLASLRLTLAADRVIEEAGP